MHKYIIMGVQGCGKGTQAQLLKEALDLVHISVGDIFRWHIQSHTKLGAPGKGIEILFCTDPNGVRIELAGPVKA